MNQDNLPTRQAKQTTGTRVEAGDSGELSRPRRSFLPLSQQRRRPNLPARARVHLVREIPLRERYRETERDENTHPHAPGKKKTPPPGRYPVQVRDENPGQGDVRGGGGGNYPVSK